MATIDVEIVMQRNFTLNTWDAEIFERCFAPPLININLL